MSESGSSYSGWLGGYAKSMAGSVSSFTQDILEETRSETQDVNSLLKHSYDKTAECEAKIQALDAEILKMKSELNDSAEDKEVAELQLQEVGDRWRAIIKEKDEEMKMMKEKIDELESDRNKEDRDSRRRSISGDIDYSDPFVCELEIVRLSKENQSLLSKVEKLSARTNENSTDRTDEESEAKIMALQAQLRSVYMEHENELGLKQQETEHIIDALREELLNSSTENISDEDNKHKELQHKHSELQLQHKREQGFFKQLEQEKDNLESKLSEKIDVVSKLELENSQLTDKSKEMEACQKYMSALEEKLAVIEAQDTSSAVLDATTAQYNSAISNLNKELALKTSETKSLHSKLSAAEQLVSNKDKEISQLRIALNTVNSEDFQELRGLVDSLKMQVDGYKESMKETGHQLLQAHHQVETLSTERVELQASVRYLEDETRRCVELVGDSEIQIKTKDDFISELQSTCSSLRKSVSEYKDTTSTLTTQHDTSVRLTNQLKAEKVELVLESKKLRDDLLKAEEEAHHLTSELSHLREHPLYYLLELEGLSEVQMLDIREICVRQEEEETDRHLSAAGGRGEQESDASEMREVKKKMADKSEQLKLLQGTISKLRGDRVNMMSLQEHDDVMSELTSRHCSEMESLEMKVSGLEDQIGQLDTDKKFQSNVIDELESKNSKLKTELDEMRENLDQKHSSHSHEETLEEKLEEMRSAADKERNRLLEEIQRLVDEAAEIEEVYTVAVSEKEVLEAEIPKLRDTLSQREEEKSTREEKLGKVTDSLKKAQARLTVKDSKIDELSDQLGTLERKLVESTELVEFYKSNQTDEYKAAQLGLSELPEVSPSFPSDAIPYVARDTPHDVAGDDTEVEDKLISKAEVLKLQQELSEAEIRHEKLVETCRDKELRIEFLEAEVAGDSPQKEVDTSKLIDQNMALQKANSVLDRELEGVRAQNVELVHQRDFYQDQAKQFHENMEQLRSEASKLINDANERGKKSAAELERLQEHLVIAEQSHAEDFLSATQSEHDLRSEVASLREQVITLNQSLDSARSDNAQEVTMVTSQLHVASTQRDEALVRLSSLEEQAAFHQTSLTNLQIALEQFQQDREGYASEVEDQYKRDMEVMKEQLTSAETLIASQQARISEMKLIEEDFQTCKEDSKTKDDRIQCLQREVSKLDVALKVAQEGLQKVRCTSEDKVERSLMKAFFTQYITAPDNRKPEVLRLMTSILNYSEEEVEALHRSRDKKWMTGIFPPSAGANNTTAIPGQEMPTGQSFSELFVSFLETEANRGSVMGSRPLTSPPPLRPSAPNLPPLTTHHQRSPSTSSASFHQRSPSSASTASSHSLPASLSKESVGPPSDAVPSDLGTVLPGAPTTATAGLLNHQTLHTSPLVVPASLSDLLSNKPR